MRYLRPLSLGGATAALLGSVLLLMGADAKENEKKEPTAAQQYKNIKVLTDLPASQLMLVMNQYNVALGVQCGFCHDLGDFAKDVPHKNAAREMILMTRRLNEKEPSVEKQVTCFMCHRGEEHPARSLEEAKKRAAAREAAEKKRKEAQEKGQ